MREVDTLRNVDMAPRKADDSITKKFIQSITELPRRFFRSARIAPRRSAPRWPIATQHVAFDFQAAETAEMLREHQALEAMMQQQLKNEDEVMKKWIAMI